MFRSVLFFICASKFLELRAETTYVGAHQDEKTVSLLIKNKRNAPIFVITCYCIYSNSLLEGLGHAT